MNWCMKQYDNVSVVKGQQWLNAYIKRKQKNVHVQQSSSELLAAISQPQNGGKSIYSQEKFARATGTHAWVTWSMANPIIWLGGPQRKEAMCLALPVKLQWSTAVLTDRYNFKRRGATQIFSHKTRKSAVHNAPRIETPTSVLCTWNKSDLMCIYDLMNDLHHIRGFTTMRYINWLIPYLLTYVAELLPKWL